MLDIHMIKSGKFKQNEQKIIVRDLLKQVYMLFLMQMRAKNLIFKIKEAHDMPEMIVSDKCRIMQVLANLIQNAHKFTRSGTVTVETAFDRDENKIIFSIIDTGVGITKAQQMRFIQLLQNIGATSNPHSSNHNQQ